MAKLLQRLEGQHGNEGHSGGQGWKEGGKGGRVDLSGLRLAAGIGWAKLGSVGLGWVGWGGLSCAGQPWAGWAGEVVGVALRMG